METHSNVWKSVGRNYLVPSFKIKQLVKYGSLMNCAVEASICGSYKKGNLIPWLLGWNVLVYKNSILFLWNRFCITISVCGSVGKLLLLWILDICICSNWLYVRKKVCILLRAKLRKCYEWKGFLKLQNCFFLSF